MSTVLITGASGLVGSHILKTLNNKFQWLAPNSKTLDITNSNLTQAYVETHDFDYCLHLAAYTNVDQAEIEKDKCYQINVLGTNNLFKAVLVKKKPFILVSTDFVFDGSKPQYDEDSKPNPINYYGQTKFEAEQLVKNKGMIVRLSYPYGSTNSTKHDFVKAIYLRLKNSQTVKGITDSKFTPTLLNDIAVGFDYLLNNFQNQIFHLVGKESLSPYEAFIKIAQTFKLNKKLIVPITFEQYFQNKAPRPRLGTIKSRFSFLQTHRFNEGLSLVKELLS